MEQDQAFDGETAIGRRTFMGAAAGGLVSALAGSGVVGSGAAFAQQPARGRVNIKRMMIVNSLGDLDDSYGPRPPELERDPRMTFSPGAIRAGLASGLTAFNLSLYVAQPIDAIVFAAVVPFQLRNAQYAFSSTSDHTSPLVTVCSVVAP